MGGGDDASLNSEARTLQREERAALARLGWYTASLVGAPFFVYKTTLRTVCPAAYDAYGTSFLATESGRATCAGMFAIIAVNVVLLAYVLSALGSATKAPRESGVKRD